ncbi:flavin-containing monooxygenase 5-like isoform X2 [Lineus longissimus]
MAKYIKDYTEYFGIDKLIRFHTMLKSLERKGDSWRLTIATVNEDGSLGKEEVIDAKYVAIATGHHAKPSTPKFEGQDIFKGNITHSVKYKHATTNGIMGKKVIVVGIGNSAVDVAVNAVEEGRCPKVYLSTRCGAWVAPNYIFGRPVDHYACRVLMKLPWQILNMVYETVLSLTLGHPNKWKLNPKMKALQTQPTVSPTLVHHIQRGNIAVKSNIKEFKENSVVFTNGEEVQADDVILCTGYKIDLPYLEGDVRQHVLDNVTNTIRLFKNVFSPEIGSSLAFIGFVQPASGGILAMSEIQARWFVELCRGKIKLPSKKEMEENIDSELQEVSKRYFKSARHTIQRDPIPYCDEIAEFFGAKPNILDHPLLAWKLLFSTCGASQWRLQGPEKWEKASETISNVPVTGLVHYSVCFTLFLLGVLLFYLLSMLQDMF